MKFNQCLLLFIISITFAFCQKSKPNFVIKNNATPNISLDSIHSFKRLEETLYNKGYFFFKTEIVKKDSIETYNIYLGKKINTIKLQNVPSEIQDILRTKEKNIYFPLNQVKITLKTINLFFDEKGDNFNEVKLTNHELHSDTLYCNISIQKSQKRYINKTVVKGYTKFPKRFLKHYIKSKKPFSKELLNLIENKIDQLKFVKNTKKPAVLFTKDSTHLYIYTERVKANKLDALLGFNNTEESNKLKFNGYIDISLTNALHKGETVAFKWNNTGDDQQELDLKLNSPYIFNTPLNIEYNLNIYRKDSTFVNTFNEFSIGYKPHYKHIINAYYNTESSSTLNTSTDNISEYTKNIFGVEYKYNELNAFGIINKLISLNIGTGFKKNIDDNTTEQQTFSSDVIYTIHINPINHIFLENRNAYLRSDKKNTNELYRTGGATTIRGFLEQNIVSHLYNFSNIEYRYFTNSKSYLYGFGDVGYFKNITEENKLLSLGLGYTLGIPSGLLKISYAVGKNQNSSFNVSNGLFHINFVSIF